MKQLFSLSLLCLLLILIPCQRAKAEQLSILDQANLLSQAEREALEEKAEKLTDQYQMDIVILTVDSLGHQSSEAFADDFYDENGYGIGEAQSGVLLLLSMEYRDWAISTCGDCIYALTDYDIQAVFSQIAPYLSEDRYYEAFDAYLSALAPYFDAFSKGTPIDGPSHSDTGPGAYEPGSKEQTVYYPGSSKSSGGQRFFLALGIGVIAAGIALLVMVRGMNTAKAQRNAASYLVPGTYDLCRRQDIFLYSQLRRVRRSEDNHNSHGGGSSIHTSSGGRSHGGGHGKF